MDEQFPTPVNNGGIGITSDRQYILTLDGQKFHLHPNVAQAILRGLLKEAEIALPETVSTTRSEYGQENVCGNCGKLIYRAYDGAPWLHMLRPDSEDRSVQSIGIQAQCPGEKPNSTVVATPARVFA